MSGGGLDGLSGFNVQAIAIQIPTSAVTTGDDPVIGVWSTTSRKQLPVSGPSAASGGRYVQVSRLGQPLVNEVVIPLRDKDKFNASKPKDDAQFLSYVLEPELAKLLNALYGDILRPIPETDRTDLVAVFLTGIPGLNQPKHVTPSEMLRLNTSITPTDDPHRIAVLAGDIGGFPNGRRLTDDVVDIELRAAACGYAVGPCSNRAPNNQLGDGVNKNDVMFLDEFPYVATPHEGYEHKHRHKLTTSQKLAMGVGASLLTMGIGLAGISTLRRRRRLMDA
jgi:hypothetical protein